MYVDMGGEEKKKKKEKKSENCLYSFLLIDRLIIHQRSVSMKEFQKLLSKAS